ncbi:unnamed protein product [Trichogramma brassicae]|uniref:Uncharacterized protein n=1 Tax=Trichogramma brassicae TaxID=86971 RepID=A0A6H5I4L0_9HYME|nr:unnamed protein product [Trichogramma brassicae]
MFSYTRILRRGGSATITCNDRPRIHTYNTQDNAAAVQQCRSRHHRLSCSRDCAALFAFFSLAFPGSSSHFARIAPQEARPSTEHRFNNLNNGVPVADIAVDVSVAMEHYTIDEKHRGYGGSSDQHSTSGDSSEHSSDSYDARQIVLPSQILFALEMFDPYISYSLNAD